MIIVNFGGGTNSTGLLVGALERGLRPDIVVFSDTGSEMPHTYEHLDAVSAWLVSKGLAPIQVTRWVTWMGASSRCTTTAWSPLRVIASKDPPAKKTPSTKPRRTTKAPTKKAAK